MSSTVAASLSTVTVLASIVLGVATVALLIVGWRRSATASTAAMRANSRNYGRGGSASTSRSRSGTVEVIRLPTAPYKRPNPVRRVLSLVGSGIIGVLVGVLIAVIVAYTVAYIVIELTKLLR